MPVVPTKQAGIPYQTEMVPIEAVLPIQEFDRRPGQPQAFNDQAYWDALKAHIDEHDFEDPLTLEYNNETGKANLGEGNHRLQIAQELGRTHVPLCGVLTYSDHERMKPLTEPNAYPSDQYGYFPSSFKPSDIGLPTSDEPYKTVHEPRWYEDQYPERHSSTLTPQQKASAWDKAEAELTPEEQAYVRNPAEQEAHEEQQRRILEWRLKGLTPNLKTAKSKDELHIGLDIPKPVAIELHNWAEEQDWPEGTELEPIEDYHITLLFAQDNGALDHREDDWIKHDRHAISVTGLKEFPPSEEKDGLHPIVLLVKSETIQAHHDALADGAEDAGLDVGSYAHDKFKPHITLGYGPELPEGLKPPKLTFETEQSSVSTPREASVLKDLFVFGVIGEPPDVSPESTERKSEQKPHQSSIAPYMTELVKFARQFGPLKVQQHDWDPTEWWDKMYPLSGDETLEDYKTRHPTIYDPGTHTLHVGPGGGVHEDLQTAAGNPDLQVHGWHGFDAQGHEEHGGINTDDPQLHGFGWYGDDPGKRINQEIEQHLGILKAREDNAWRFRASDSWQPKDQWPNQLPAHEPSGPNQRPEERDCTCEHGHKLDCPVHGLNATETAYEHVWDFPNPASPVGYDTDAPRTWMRAQSGSAPFPGIKFVEHGPRATLEEIRADEANGEESWLKRRPFVFDPQINTVHIGWPGSHHGDIPMDYPARDEGTGIEWTKVPGDAGPEQNSFVEWHSPPPEGADEILRAVSEHTGYPTLRPDQWRMSKRFAADEFDTREYPDARQMPPTNMETPAQGKPHPEKQGCTCEEGHKLDCPVHGMFPTEQDYDHTWSIPEGHPVGYPQDQPRNYMTSEGAWHFAAETLPQQLRRWQSLKPHPRSGRSKVVHQFPDGWTVQEHPTKFAVQAVGQMMNNCWQGKAPTLDAQGNPTTVGRPGHDAIQHYMALHDENDLPRTAFYVNEFPSTTYEPGQGFLPGEYGNGEKKIRSPWGPRNKRISDGEAERLQSFAREHGISDRFQIPNETEPVVAGVLDNPVEWLIHKMVGPIPSQEELDAMIEAQYPHPDDEWHTDTAQTGIPRADM